MADDWTAVEVTNAGGAAPVVLVCEHASRAIPTALRDLGLDATARQSHAVWDIGATGLARRLSERLDAPLVSAALSRLVYDCNRSPDAPDAIPARTEIYDIPGNRDLRADARRDRHDRVHGPFHAQLAETCRRQEARCGRPVAIITVHSFTPVWLGRARAVEIGFLHHGDDRLARAALAAERARGAYRAALDEPYSAADGVTHTLALHAAARGRRGLMIEVRNDLLATDAATARMGDHLALTLSRALAPADAEG